jgi:hypothetical protein
LRISIYEHKILALFTQMKSPSLFAAPGKRLPEAPATQAAGEGTSGKELDLGQSHRLRCPRSLADLLLQATSLKTNEQDS